MNYKNWSKVSVFNKLSNSKVNEKMALGQINERKIVCRRYFERRNAAVSYNGTHDNEQCVCP